MLKYFFVSYPNVSIRDYTDLNYTMPESILQILFHKRPCALGTYILLI